MATKNPAEWRCTNCDALLGMRSGANLRIRYKDHEVLVFGQRVRVPCRRCRVENDADAAAPNAA
jgi:hypothetical protein